MPIGNHIANLSIPMKKVSKLCREEFIMFLLFFEYSRCRFIKYQPIVCLLFEINSILSLVLIITDKKNIQL